MAPKPNPHNLKLDKEAFANNDDGKQANNDARPKRIRLVIGGSAGIPAVNLVTLGYREHGFGGGDEGQRVKLGGVAYELAPGQKADPTLDQFRVAFESPGNVPVTLVTPLTGAVEASKIPPPDTPPQFAQVCYSVPTIQRAADVQGDAEAKWLEFFKVASERELTIELAVAPKDDVREAVEKLLGKVWDAEVAAAKEAGKEDDDVNKHGVRILFAGLASPPLNESSSQLARSQALESWSDFVSRLALNPRVFLKISPLPLPSLLPAAIGTPRRPVDTPGSGVAVPGSHTAGSLAQAATDAATQAVAAVESATLTSAADRRNELQQRLRVFLETALEAFGEERLTFSTHLSAGSATASAAAQKAGVKDDHAHLTEPEQWFEAVVSTMQQIGLKQEAFDNVFDLNVSKVYRM